MNRSALIAFRAFPAQVAVFPNQTRDEKHLARWVRIPVFIFRSVLRHFSFIRNALLIRSCFFVFCFFSILRLSSTASGIGSVRRVWSVRNHGSNY